MIIFLLAIVESACLNTTNIKHTTETLVSQQTLPFCSEHSSRTCCDSPSALNIYKKLYRSLMDPPIFEGYDGYSNTCLSYTQKALCSDCDGDIGEGVIEGLCEKFCDGWHKACAEDFFVANNKEIEFCHGNSLICFKLREIVESGSLMCEKFGYAVRSEQCFDGVASAIRKGPVVKEKAGNFEIPYTQLLLLLPTIFVVVFLFTLYRSLERPSIEEIRAQRIKQLSK